MNTGQARQDAEWTQTPFSCPCLWLGACMRLDHAGLRGVKKAKENNRNALPWYHHSGIMSIQILLHVLRAGQRDAG
jgi:hypothetical protein